MRHSLIPNQFARKALPSLIGLPLILCCILGTGIASADTVFLKDGNEYEGEVISVSRFAVVLRVKDSGQLRSFSRSSIDIIIYEKRPVKKDNTTTKKPDDKKGSTKPTEGNKDDGAEKPGTEGTGKKDGGEEGTEKKGDGEEDDPEKKDGEEGEGEETDKEGEENEGEEDAEKAKKGKDGEGEWPELSEDLQEFVDKQMKLLESNNPADRTEGKSKLRGKGKETIPALIKGLNHRSLYARSCSADLLGDFTARNGVKYLIETLYAVMPPKGQAPAYQRNFVRSLKVALEKTTGQYFISSEPSSPLVQEGLQKYIDWYNKEYDRLPPQVGEAEIDPTDPEYVEKLKKARELKLAKRSWPRPPMSADQAIGKKAKVPKGGGERKADKEFKERFPKADRESAGGLIRESDKKYGNDFFKRDR